MYFAFYRSESTDSSSDTITDAVYYNDDNRLPVHEWGLVKGKKISEIAKILLGASSNDTKIATAIPTDVSKNTTFLMDTSYVDLQDDLKCDDLGIWHCTGVKMEFFRLKRGSIKKVDAKKGKNPGVFKVTRRFYYNDNVNSLKKVLRQPLILTKIAIAMTFCNIYLRTESKKCTRGPMEIRKPTTIATNLTSAQKNLLLTKLKRNSSRTNQKKIVHSVIEDLGGIEKVRSGSDIPRNRKQVYNAVQSISRPGRISDPLVFLTQKCKELRDEKT